MRCHPRPNNRRKGSSGSLLHAEQAGDALDAFSIASGLIAAEPAATQVQRIAVGCAVGQKISSSSTQARQAVSEHGAASNTPKAEENAEELRQLRGQCRQQAQDLLALRRQLDESDSQLETARADTRCAKAGQRQLQETLNMQSFKYELLLDLVSWLPVACRALPCRHRLERRPNHRYTLLTSLQWCMRVLDNEELGQQGEPESSPRRA